MSKAEKVFACISLLMQIVIVAFVLLFSASEGAKRLSDVSQPIAQDSCGRGTQAPCSPAQVEAILAASDQLQRAYAIAFEGVRTSMENIGYALIASIALQLLAMWGVLVKGTDKGSGSG